MRTFVLLLSLTISLALLACGEGDGGETEVDVTPPAATTPPPTTAPPRSGPPQGGGTTEAVSAVLSEFNIVLDRYTAPPGDVTFALHNRGSFAHEFWVLRTDLPGDSLPLEGETGRVDVQSDEVEVVLMQGVMPPGNGPELALELTDGHYLLICNLPGHYESGMYADFLVRPE